MGDLQHVHNNFFLKVFKESANTADFIKGVFPPEIVKTLDLKSVKTENTSYVDEKLRSHCSDLVIKMNTKTGEKTDIYVLFEHKSYIDTTILWQLLRYQYLMLEEDYNTKRKFRIIVPIVFYHGKTKWKIEKSFAQTMKVPELLKKYVLNFEYMLFDTRDFDLSQNEMFGKNVYLMSAISLMKNRKSMTAEKMTRLFEYLVKGGMQNDLDLIVILLKYLLSTNKVEESEVADIIRKELGSKAEELMPSLAKKWFEQGKEEGREEGREKGAFLKAVETCRNALRSGISADTVALITGLSKEKVLEIQKEMK